MIGFLSALLLAVVGFGQPVLAEFVAPVEECCSAAPSGTQLFRAVEPAELADLQRSGQFRAGGPHAEWLDGKRFWLSEADANRYVDIAEKGGIGGPYCVTSGCIPDEVFGRLQVVEMDGRNAVFIPNDLLPFIDDLNLPSPP